MNIPSIIIRLDCTSHDVYCTVLFIKLHSNTVQAPFPQTDIIGDVVIVWRVRGKISRSVLCNIVCNNCSQCNAHTYEQTNRSLDLVLSHWAHFTVLRFIFVYLCKCMYFLYDCLLYECVVIVTWWD